MRGGPLGEEQEKEAIKVGRPGGFDEQRENGGVCRGRGERVGAKKDAHSERRRKTDQAGGFERGEAAKRRM